MIAVELVVEAHLYRLKGLRERSYYLEDPIGEGIRLEEVCRRPKSG